MSVILGVSRDLITLQVGIPAYAGMTREYWNDKVGVWNDKKRHG
jgi:hypothetical protein